MGGQVRRGGEKSEGLSSRKELNPQGRPGHYYYHYHSGITSATVIVTITIIAIIIIVIAGH